MFARSILVCVVMFACASLSAPAHAVPARAVSRVLIRKAEHAMVLMGPDDQVIASYQVAIGPGGGGHKRMEGDMTTPVGRYHIVSHEPSQYRTFLRLDYPTAADRRRFMTAKERGELPPAAKIGGDIGIHGPPVSMSEELRAGLKAHDWTAGCIAVDDGEIAEIARLVRDGTIVDIEP